MLDLSRMRQLDGPVPQAIEDAIGGDLDAREALAAAVERGLVPETWRDDPLRCFPDQEVTFFCDACGGMGATGWNYDEVCDVCNGRGNSMTRSSVALPVVARDMLWMFAVPDAVEQAEALAREAVRRLGESEPLSKVERVQWGRVCEHKPIGTVPVLIHSAIWSQVSRPPAWDWEAMKGPAFAGTPWYPEARKLPKLTREILCADVGMAWAHAQAGLHESPFEPVLRLWELGVVIEELDAEKVVIERVGRRYIRSWRSGMSLG